MPNRAYLQSELNKKQANYIKEQGFLHEASAQKTIGGDAVNLNRIATNFPTYDITSSTEVASVKSHMHIGTEPTNQDLNMYVHDFHYMLGWGRAYEDGLDPIQRDGKNIAEIRDRGAPVPESLKGASQQEINEYLKHNSVLRIPDDHVEGVQNLLEPRIRETPENYFLEENPPDEQVQSVLDRIKGTGLTSAETLDQLVENGPTEGVVTHNSSQNVFAENTPDTMRQSSETEIAQLVGETTGNVAAGPAGEAAGKVASEVAGKTQSETLESVGHSTENPTEATKQANNASSASNSSEQDEEQQYGYGFGY